MPSPALGRLRGPVALPPGGGGDPARQRGGIPEVTELAHQPLPYHLADVGGVGG